ncbi:hypothetical protein [Mucilaginibacter glaciei]|uniref:Uncharacterized protein n=1 Tax=Mucilaginibacter glaciei TaxID=2772109 RepID=A0A926S2X6_9SPHI|nr:hypothetical protein [Mucilaginibacter glaciei]MBD1394628.1 hypothetical protein [Mucilaginibacter glaciei]
MSKTETARQLALQTIAQKQSTEHIQQVQESQEKNNPQVDEERALLIQTLEQMQLNATANTKFLREMTASQQQALQRITALENKANNQQAVTRRWRNIVLLTLTAIVMLILIYKVIPVLR